MFPAAHIDTMVEMSRPPFPDRIVPDLVMKVLNEPVLFRASGMSLRIDSTSQVVPLSGQLQLRWLPSPAAEFEGDAAASTLLGETTATLLLDKPASETAVILTHVGFGSGGSSLRCILSGSLSVAHATTAATRLRFYLANFPEYVGEAVKRDNSRNDGWFRGRLILATPDLTCVVDSMPEVDELRKQAAREAGYLLTHVCEVTFSRPTAHDAMLPLLGDLHLFFGLLRGAWAGPVLPRAYSNQDLAWEQVAAWVVDDPRRVDSWFPSRSPLNLSAMFKRFLALCSSPQWSDALRTALSWYVEANAARVPHEVRIVLAQVAIDLLACVELVEVRQLFQPEPFDKVGAAKRIRHLLTHLAIPLDVPSHLADLATMAKAQNRDGPGIVVYTRNRLAHATESNRQDLAAVSSMQLWEAAQLSLQYVELALLALLGYDGSYARRGWRGWKGPDETTVPWA